MSVLFDIQGVQSPAHGERGIARYLLELSAALERECPEAVSRYLLNPDLPVPGRIDPIVSSGRLEFNDRVEYGAATVYHVGSLFEPGVPIDRLWPPAARQSGLRLAITLYDLIPHIFPEGYLSDPVSRLRYLTRLDSLRHADRLLAISEASARDAVERLGIGPDRIRVVGAGVSERFARPARGARPLESLIERDSRVRPGFVLYTGGIDYRKNVDRLLEAYAALPASLRARHQLVVVCVVDPASRVALDRRLDELRLADEVYFPGFVPDDELILYYQASELFVFPSLYEGYGLPVAEAMACGAPVIAGRTSSIVELVDDDAALFDPAVVRSIRDALERALTDDELRGAFAAKRLPERHTWPEVARRTAAAYEELASAGRRPPRRKRRIAFVSPLPPQGSGIADYSGRLLEHLTEHCTVDAFVDEPVTAPDGVTIRLIRRFDSAARSQGGYDRVVYALGNSEFHAEAFALLRRHAGVVLAHDLRLAGLYAWTAHHRPDLEPRSLREAVEAMYGARVPEWLGASGWIAADEVDRYGVLMTREAIAQSERYLLHSDYMAQLARLDAGASDAGKVGVIPFAFPDPDEFSDVETSRSDTPLVATFGIAAAEKQTDKIIDAFAEVVREVPDTRLVIGGRPASPGDGDLYRAQIDDLGLSGRAELTGQLDRPSYLAWLRRATLAVQLRTILTGEPSAAVADCLAAGTPAIVTEAGWTRELPDDSVVRVPRGVGVSALADEIVRLLRDEEKRAALASAGVEHARQNSFARSAELLYRELNLS